eukprot:CAMPEP_0185791998 /NCGR_PEP_ID=MMETSP1174-20130828/158689_1 /TAXON_ID=35687 /ORGANISM="Dictyocha speculum, Strain CCMP1381" /LENGTH=168 /DNA_ID=CAMNT_0028487011 /DNA_START=1 /DNA_END=507 /DNA_ORIENTATION=-
MHGAFRKLGGGDVTIYDISDYANYDAAIDLDPPMHDTYMPFTSSSLRCWAAPPTTPNETSMQDRLSTLVGKWTETRTFQSLSHRCDADWGGDVTVTGVPVTTRSIFPNNYTCIPQTTCNDATVNGMGGEEEVTEYLRDDTAMMNYFFACDVRRHNFASSDYFCAYKNP